MKEKIHPKWFPEASVSCACGNAFKVGSTKPTMRVEVCSQCHPFYTGTQRMLDTGGQVERFMRRLGAKDKVQQGKEQEPVATATEK